MAEKKSCTGGTREQVQFRWNGNTRKHKDHRRPAKKAQEKRCCFGSRWQLWESYRVGGGERFHADATHTFLCHCSAPLRSRCARLPPERPVPSRRTLFLRYFRSNAVPRFFFCSLFPIELFVKRPQSPGRLVYLTGVARVSTASGQSKKKQLGARTAHFAFSRRTLFFVSLCPLESVKRHQEQRKRQTRLLFTHRTAACLN